MEQTIARVRDPEQAARMLQPLRLEILELAREPRSAADIAHRLGLPRQRVNYHVKELARAGLLQRAGRRRKGNLIEQRYRASARSYVLDPGLLGRLAVDRGEVEDALSAGRLLALSARTQREVGGLMERAQSEGRRLATLSIDVDVSFSSAAERARFATELRDQVTALAARYGGGEPEPVSGEQESKAGREFRLLVGCYPRPSGVGGEEGQDARKPKETT